MAVMPFFFFFLSYGNQVVMMMYKVNRITAKFPLNLLRKYLVGYIQGR